MDGVCREPQTLGEWKAAYFVVLARAQQAEAIAREVKQQYHDRRDALLDAVTRAEQAEAERDEALDLLQEWAARWHAYRIQHDVHGDGSRQSESRYCSWQRPRPRLRRSLPRE